MSTTSADNRRRMAWFFAAAVLLRLTLMPLTMHTDLVFVHYFPHFLSGKGIWDVYGYFGLHYLDQGFTYYAPMVYYAFGFFQWLLQGLNPAFQPWMEHVHRIFYAHAAIPAELYVQPLSKPELLRTVFWMKIPYLILEAGALWLFLQSLNEPLKSKAVRLWLFNPVLLFSAYVFGQYRMLSVFFVCAVLAALLRRSKEIACLAFGFLCLSDSFPFLLLVPVVLILGKSVRERSRILFFILLPVLIVVVPLWVSSNGFVLHSFFSPLIQRVSTQSIFRHYAAETGPFLKIIFVSAYLGMIYWLARAKETTPTQASRLLVYAGLAVLLVLYATSTTVIHYFMWAVPFWIWVQAEGEPWPRGLSWVLLFLLFLFNLDSRALNLGLFLPLDPARAMAYPSLHEVMDRMVPWGRIIAGSRGLFSLLCLVFAWKLFNRKIRPLVTGSPDAR